MKKVLSFLQGQVDIADDKCRFAIAMGKVLRIARPSDRSCDIIYISTPVEEWPDLEDLVDRLVNNYSTVLNVSVHGEERDFLVWNGIDVPSIFGTNNLEPDVEHICVAILISEGVFHSIPMTNWDGLVEAAVERLSDEFSPILRVIVKASDFTTQQARTDLLKFHGCAVRAVRDPDEYRHLLIARDSQISAWAEKSENHLMRTRLEHLIASRPALIIGLSAQDADIRTMLHSAPQHLVRHWPASPPAAVFAVEELDHRLTHVLEATYGDSYHPNQPAIDESAVLGAYAKPVLLGLVLYVLADKLCALIAKTRGLNFGVSNLDRLQDDVRALRDIVGQAANGDPRDFIDRFIRVFSLILSVFRWDSSVDPADTRYEPLTVKPIAEAQTDPNFSGDALGRLGIAASLLGRGLVGGIWTLDMGSAENLGQGVVQVVPHGKDESHVFLVRDAGVLSKLEAEGHVRMTDPRVLIVHAEQIPARLQRSSRTSYGRTGKPTSREIDIESLCSTAADADDLFDGFRRVAGL